MEVHSSDGVYSQAFPIIDQNGSIGKQKSTINSVEKRNKSKIIRKV